MKRIIYMVAVLCIATTATAQNLLSGYYTEGNLYRHDINPAIGNDRNYVSIPVIGNLDINMNSNLKVKHILFNRGGKTVLFTNPMVDPGEVLGNIKDIGKVADNIGGGRKALNRRADCFQRVQLVRVQRGISAVTHSKVSFLK